MITQIDITCRWKKKKKTVKIKAQLELPYVKRIFNRDLSLKNFIYINQKPVAWYLSSLVMVIINWKNISSTLSWNSSIFIFQNFSFWNIFYLILLCLLCGSGTRQVTLQRIAFEVFHSHLAPLGIDSICLV